MHCTITRPYSQNPCLWQYSDGCRWLSYGALQEYGLNIYPSSCKLCIWAYKICIRLVSFTWSVQKFKLTLIEWLPFIFCLFTWRALQVQWHLDWHAPDSWSSISHHLDLWLNLSPVHRGSGLNLRSGENCSSTNYSNIKVQNYRK